MNNRTFAEINRTTDENLSPGISISKGNETHEDLTDKMFQVMNNEPFCWPITIAAKAI